MAKLKKSPKELKQELKAKRMEKVIKKQEEKKMKKRKTSKTAHECASFFSWFISGDPRSWPGILFWLFLIEQ